MARYRTGMGKLFRKRRGGRLVGSWTFIYQGRYISTGTTNKETAERFQRRFLGDERRAAKSRLTGVRIADLLATVLEDYRRRGLRTVDRLESRIETIESLIGNRLAEDFRATDVGEYIDLRDDAGLAAASINRELETIRRGFRLGLERELISWAPKVRLLPEENVRKVDLPPADYDALITELRQPVRLMAIIAYHIGWRAGRIRTLKWPQVNFDAGVIRPDERQASNKWVGAAPIYGDLRKALLVAYASHEKHWPNVDWVLHRGGQQLVTYRKEWERARKKIGREDLRFHDFRHAAVTNMLVDCLRVTITTEKTSSVYAV